MSSRQEEKEKRKQERLARESAEAARIKRLRLVQLAIGGLLAAAAIAAVVIAVSSSGGGSSSKPKSSARGVALPKQQIADLAPSVKAAHCAVHTYPIFGRNHVDGDVKYKTNPPTSGDHNATPSLDGVYEPDSTPAKENFVHTLEHARVEFQYAPGTPHRRIAQLETLQSESLQGFPGYKTLLFQNNTKMKYAVAATAWGHLIGCSKFSDRVFDALRAFRKQYVDKGPESPPPTNTG